MKKIIVGILATVMLASLFGSGTPYAAYADEPAKGAQYNMVSMDGKAAQQVLESIHITNLSPVYIGAVQSAKIMARYKGSDQLIELKQGVKFSSSKPKAATVDANGTIKGISVGATVITASFGGKTASYTVVVNKAGLKPKKRELRAAWIATVDKIDWPKTTGKEQQKQEYVDLLNMHQSLGMNAIVMQIKPTADAFYPSQYAPWSHWLTGKQGQHPGYDPLAFMIEEAHERNMEFHAWFNPYRVSVKNDLSSLTADHPARLNPEWVMEYKGRLYFDPGHPEVINYITKSVMEVVEKYDIDAVHFDDYFYPNQFDGPNYPDQATYEKYGKRNYPNDINAWRRNNVDTLIKSISQKIKEKKSYVKFGISPFGVWRNKSEDPNGSDTRAGQPSYDNLHADIRKWVLNGWIDYVAPQIYWNFGFAPAAYEELVQWWSDLIRENNAKTQLYIGHADYKVDVNEHFTDPNEIANQLKFNLNYEEVKGSIHFTTRDLISRPHLRQMIKEAYRYPALVPTMPWLGGQSQQAKAGVTSMSAMQQAAHVKVSWTDTDASTAYWVVYRSAGNEEIDIENPAHIKEIIRKNANQATYFDDQVVLGETYHYAVTAVNRLHYESGLSPITSVKLSVNPGACPPVGLSDVRNHWANDYIYEAVEECIVTGYTDGTFRPEKPVSREEFAVMLVRALGLEAEESQLVFDDTGLISDWAKSEVGIAVNLGIITGYSDETFRPQHPINRAEVTAMAVRALELDRQPALNTSFADDPIIPEWAKEYVNAAVDHQIIQGRSGNQFAPLAETTRAEAAVIMLRLMAKS